MPKTKIVSLKRLQQVRASQIKISFTLDPESHEGRIFLLATQHYGAAGGDWTNAIAKSLLKNWLASHVQFPIIELGD